VCHGNLPCLYEAAAPEGYIDDERALEIMQGLDPAQMALLGKFASQISNQDMDLLFYLGGEVEYLLGKVFD
jgi:hypothetical protein